MSTSTIIARTLRAWAESEGSAMAAGIYRNAANRLEALERENAELRLRLAQNEGRKLSLSEVKAAGDIFGAASAKLKRRRTSKAS